MSDAHRLVLSTAHRYLIFARRTRDPGSRSDDAHVDLLGIGTSFEAVDGSV